MAKDTKAAAAVAAEFDLAKWLTPEMGKASDFREIEGLVPSYTPEAAFEGGWDPVVGFLDRLIVLPTQGEGKATEYTPLAFQIILERANKAMTGSKDSRKVVDVAAGSPILVFVSGNLITARDLWYAATDAEHVSPVVLAVTGQEKLADRQSPMWTWKKVIGAAKKPRTGQFTLSSHDVSRAQLPELVLLARKILKAKDLPTANGQSQVAALGAS